jgi:peptide/nickel transport system substrate-binding protein
LAPTSQAQLQWPKWGDYFATRSKAGEPVDVPEAAHQVDLYNKWLAAGTREDRRAIWQEMLMSYVDNVFSIGTVNNARQPVVVNKKLRNVPEDGIFTWEPTAYFGVYRPDTFWFDQ